MSDIDKELLKLVDVMISSTTKDLPKHRQEAMTAVRRAGMRPIWMEDLSATSNSDAIKESLKMVDEAEIYVGILGHRYGFIPDDIVQNPNQVSITELEYQRAVERNLPIYIFMIDAQHTLPPATETIDFYETNPVGKEKLVAFKGYVARKHIVKWFTSPEDLRASLYQSLTQDIQEIQRAIEIALAKTTLSASKSASFIAIPPQMYVVSEYNLRSIRFVGRKKELDILDIWSQSSQPMCVVEAIGGMGKSSLTWHWTQDRATGFEGIFWYSFYEDGATMKDWSRHAYAYVTQQNPIDLKEGWKASNEQLTQLLHILRRKRYLFVLDGFERVLVAYHRWNTAQMQDDDVENLEQIIDKNRDMRVCTNPNDSDLLQLLIDAGLSKVLITSRLMPRELEEAGQPRLGVQRIALKGLAPEDALTYMNVLGIKTTSPTTLDMFMRQLGYHTLLLRIVAGTVNEFRASRGNFDRWYERVGNDFRLSEWDAKQKRNHILKFAYEGLDETHQKLLSQIAAFGGAVSYDTLLILNPFFKPPTKILPNPMDSIAFEIEYVHHSKSLENPLTPDEEAYHREELNKLEEQIAIYNHSVNTFHIEEQYPKTTEYKRALMQFEEMLAILEERGLLEYNRDTDLYDLHPVIRGYAYDKLDHIYRSETHEKILDYYTQQPRKRLEQVHSLEDLKNGINLYRALVNAGHLDDASDFYSARLSEVLGYHLSAYDLIVELLSPLFTAGITQFPTLKNTHVQLARITNITTALHYLGRHNETLALESLALHEAVKHNYPNRIAIYLRNYAVTLRSVGKLYQSRVATRLALEIAVANGYSLGIVLATLSLIFIYFAMGDMVSAKRAYAELNDMWKNLDDADFWQASAELLYLTMLNALETLTLEAIDAVEKQAQKSKNSYVLRQLPRIRGDFLIQSGNLEAGQSFIEIAIKQANESGDKASLKESLGSLLRLKMKLVDNEHVQRLLQEDLNFLDKAEGYLYLKDYDSAQEYALKAYRKSWADGIPYVWLNDLTHAKKILDTLQIDYPVLQPFRLEDVEKIPCEDEIIVLIENLKTKKNDVG